MLMFVRMYTVKKYFVLCRDFALECTLLCNKSHFKGVTDVFSATDKCEYVNQSRNTT